MEGLGGRGHPPVVQLPCQRQSISAASAINAKGGFWFCTYEGGLHAELFVDLLAQMMRYRRKPVHLVLDSLPAHKTAAVKQFVASVQERLTLHFLPGYAPDLNPDEWVWSHIKRTGAASIAKRRETARQNRGAARQAPKTAPPRALIFPSPFCRLYWRPLSNILFICPNAEVSR